MTFKCIKNIPPKYLVDLQNKRTAPRAKRSAKDDLLLERTNLLERNKRTKLVTTGDQSFVHVAPCLWNELPYSLRAANSVETFKTLLETFLFRKHFSINNVYIMFYQFLSFSCKVCNAPMSAEDIRRNKNSFIIIMIITEPGSIVQNVLFTTLNHTHSTEICKFKIVIKYEKWSLVIQYCSLLQLLTISFLSAVQINSLFLFNSLIVIFSF